MAKFIIGKQEYEAQALSFRQLKQVWPHVSATIKHLQQQADSGIDPRSEEAVIAGFEAVETGAEIIAIALVKTHPEMTKDRILDELLPAEVPDVSAAIQELMIEAGLVQSGPRAPAGVATQAANPSTVTGTQSSPSSSPPDAREEAGT